MADAGVTAIADKAASRKAAVRFAGKERERSLVSEPCFAWAPAGMHAR